MTAAASLGEKGCVSGSVTVARQLMREGTPMHNIDPGSMQV